MRHPPARGATPALLLGSLVLVAGGVAAGLLLGRQASAERDPVTTHGEWIAIRKSATETIRAYIAFPERSDPAPGVIVIHEVYGLTDWEPTVADRLAAGGYVAIVPDLLSSRFGSSPATADSGRKLIAQLVPEAISADLDAVFAHLDGLPAVAKGRIGTIGFCWGGAQSFRYATHNPALKAAVVCYGSAPDSAALAKIRSPVLGVYGEQDARINAALPAVEAQMKALGKSFEHDLYPGTGHGFLKPGRRGHDTDQPARAWERILSFYGTALGK